jgi:hypothetical protein
VKHNEVRWLLTREFESIGYDIFFSAGMAVFHNTTVQYNFFIANGTTVILAKPGQRFQEWRLDLNEPRLIEKMVEIIGPPVTPPAT